MDTYSYRQKHIFVQAHYFQNVNNAYKWQNVHSVQYNKIPGWGISVILAYSKSKTVQT